MTVTRRALTLAALALLAGCGKGGKGGGLTLDRAVAPAAEALHGLLLGPGERPEPLADPPLLTAKGRTRVVLASDADGFARTIDGRVRAQDVRRIESALINALKRPLEKRGFTIAATGFPPTAPDASTIAVSLEPLTENGSLRRDGSRTALLLVRMTLTDNTHAILARRDFYSGYDLDQLRDERPMDAAPRGRLQ